MAPSRSTRSLRRLFLGSSMLIALGPVGSAHAAQLAVAMQSYTDPLMANLAIPASAPQTGMWSSLQTWPLTAIHMAVLPSGKIVSYGAPQGKAVQDGRTYDVWDPAQGFAGRHVVLPGVTGVNSFCAAQAFRSDGSLVISGGIFDNNQDTGSAVLNSAATTVAGLGAQLAADRYYGSMITQADGSLIMLGGDYPYAAGWSDPQTSIDKGWNAGMTPEVYTPAGGWRSLFGANSRDAFGPDNSRYWYPHAWVAPNGKIFGISSDTMWFLDSTGSGSITPMAFKAPPTNVANRTDPAPNTGPDSTAVLYDRGKILQIGGNSMTNFNGLYYASRAASTIDINGTTPAVTDIAPMTYPRSWSNATLLPTGKIAVTGGSAWGDYATSTTNDVTTNESIQAEETWDPATGAWTVGPSAAVYRGYHSTAILLQNGAVLSAGGGIPGPVSNMNAEVYYPPYLFTTVNGQAQLAPRPQIVSLNSTQVSHGQTMQIEVGSADTIAQVVLIGLSEVTHSFNSGQRRSVLPFTRAGTILSAQLPASTADAPPGYYQLVAIDGNGVPSPGAIVALGAQVAAPTTTALPAGLTKTPAASDGTGGTEGGGTSATAATGAYAASLAATTLTPGAPVGFQLSNFPDRMIRHRNFLGYADQIAPGDPDDTFTARAGLANASCYSFESTNYPGSFLRHYAFRLSLNKNDGSAAFNGDATFCLAAPLSGSGDTSFASLQSYNFPGYYLRHRNFELWVDKNDASTQFQADATFKVIGAPVSAVVKVGNIVNLTPAAFPDRRVRHRDLLGYVDQIAANNPDAVFTVRAGLASASCYSFESTNYPGSFLRHYAFRLSLNKKDGSDVFNADATFCSTAPLNGNSDPSFTSLQSYNFPGYYLRHRNFELWVDQNDGSAQFGMDASFKASTASQ